MYSATIHGISNKTDLKNLPNRLWFDNFWSESSFSCFENKKSIIFESSFQKAEKKQISFKAAAEFRLESLKFLRCLYGI